MIELTPAQRRAFRAQAHHLHPVVSVAGNGLTEAVLAEIDHALQAHELIKIRVYGEDRSQRDTILSTVCERLEAAAVQHIGKTLVVWREKRELEKAVGPVAEKPKRSAALAKSAKALSARRNAARAAQKPKVKYWFSAPGTGRKP